MEVSRRRSRTAMALLYTGAVLVALAVLAVLSARHGGRWDVTERKVHSLRPETQALVDSIPDGAEPVDIVAVTSAMVAGNDSREAEMQIRPLLEVFQRSSPKLRATVRLAESEPALVQQLGIDRVPIAVLHWRPPAGSDAAPPEERERRTFDVTESGIAQALRDLLEDRKRVAYVLFGHDEMRIGDDGAAGFALAAHALRGINFDVRDLALVGTANVPDDADLLILAGPQSDVLPEEAEAFDRYAARGGRFLVLDGPTREPGRLPTLHGWLIKHWNVGPTEGIACDIDGPLGSDPRILLLTADPASHPMLASLHGLVQMPLTRSLAVLDRSLDGVAPTSVLQSGPRSWLETGFLSSAPAYDEGLDLRGPLSLAVAVTRKPTGQAEESRLVAFGSRMMFANQHVGTGGNMELLRDAADWATGREEDIVARRGSGEDGGLVISRRQGRIILGEAIVIPLIVAAAGVIFWWRRRRL